MTHFETNGTPFKAQSSQNKKTLPHYRMTFQQALEDFRDGLITPRGILYYSVATTRKKGFKRRIPDIQEFCALVGISVATYYRALGYLKGKNRLDMDSVGGMQLWIPTEEKLETNSTQHDLQHCETVSQDCENLSQHCETVSQDCENLSHLRESKTLKLIPSRLSGNPPDPYYLLSNSSSPLSQAQRENQDLKIKSNCLFAGGEISLAYKTWLLSKASKLPEYPILIELWVEKQSQKEANQREFLEDLDPKKRRSAVLAAPDFFQIEGACLAAMVAGDREWVKSKLQGLWSDDFVDLLQELLELHQNWGFVVTVNGIEDIQ
ncbi:hypothetical protein H6F86_16705 [Phormidium sp. FACHB-592]|uniref:Uncharacterized protein n=1 Tax=Stenomitos frigidus AS-A4 TaxID=2933935 RepID=A0ABV0KPC9_9CYAN|nr:hypothetical protein [Phormidium sp. FACHB-592]MBD2075506.1 hypothetical protein [Phormidium sp. FACHB-592]